jgi:hypothetical protein
MRAMDIDSNLLIVSLLFGSIGVGLLMYGKKAGRPVPLIAGLALVAVPYFIPNMIALLIVCTLLTALPWVLRNA